MTPTVQPTLTYNCPHCQVTLEAPAHCGTQEINVCPACHRTFQVDLQGTGTAAAPANVPPAAPQVIPTAQPVAQPAAVAQPLVAAVPAEAPEAAIEQIHLSMVRRYPARCLAYFAALTATAVVAVLCLTWGYPIVASIAGAALAYLLIHFGLWWLRMRSTTLTVTDRRVVIETGLFTHQTTEVARKDVTDVLVAQDPVMRLLGVGDLVIRAHGQKEVVLMAVPHPDEVAHKITPPAPLPAANTAGAA
jgi:membrane protein YdbS with pleckstrin-like domain